MAPQVQRAKTAFQFYQSSNLGEIKNELGPGTTMGIAMTELSARWKNMSDDARSPYFDMEEEDRRRYATESAEADSRAAAEQSARREKLRLQKGERSSHREARKRIDSEREEKQERRKRRRDEILEEMDPEEREERDRIKAAKRAETAKRQKLREAQEKALKDRHKKMEKNATVQSNKRLEYLLKQSSIFAKLKMGTGSHKDEDDEVDRNAATDSHSRRVAHVKPKKGKKTDDEDLMSEEEELESHVFLSKQPSSIIGGTLKPYQLEGLNWMIHLAEKGLNGILADEMGLGKTLQSISILAYQLEYMKCQGPHLICVPKSTLSNWMKELKRWCPSLRAIRFHGSREEREEMTRKYFTPEAAAHDGRRPTKQIKNPETGEMEDDNSKNPRKWDVCLTTYEICNTEKKVLSRMAWKYLVIDEAHRLKNETSIFSKTVREFKTAHRLLLTGTPLQNNLHELWALLNFLLPDIFSSSEQFDEWFNLEIDDDDAKKNMISQLHKILRPFMIRRLKSDVAKGLPPKTETLIMVGMSSMQKKLYKKLLLRDIDSITSNNAGTKNKTAILNIVMQLRKCCGHPYLFEGVEDRSLDPLGEHLVENCGKLVMVDKLLRRLKERGSRVLIFTQMTRVLDILEDYMVMRGYKYCRIDGNTDYEVREAGIESFNAPNSDKFCFILSTRAGGLGINLQTADTCILYDSDWNPQADLQAQDRCHRLGQTKHVNIYRLVSENTVEEKIVERAQQKLKLDAMVVQQGRLKEKDKVGKDEMLAAVRFGADTVFRSEESTITDEDIDVILERGAARTKELADKIQKAEKGDLLDFRLDAGMSAQTFEGIDYSDRELRNQLRLLAADSVGKRERKPPPLNYNPIIAPKKSMMVNNRKIKLPKSLRLPRMEDHQFYNRERLLDLGKLEFQTYAALRNMGKLPPREAIDKAKTLLPDELAQEKLDLLSEGFGDWTRSQYFQFVKACAKFGRDDMTNISGEMDMPVEKIVSYSEAFWKYAPTELKKDEWERALQNIEKGEQKIAKKKKLSALLAKFVGTFKDPRKTMTFANKGTAHFTLEQDRALLTSVNKLGYGSWDAVREELQADVILRFQHSVQGMNCDMIGKRCDYRMRQMERELELRAKKLKSEKPPSVIAAMKAIEAVKEMEKWEKEAIDFALQGKEPPSLKTLSEECQQISEERIAEKQTWIDRIREIEIQVRDCKALAEDTRKAIMRGDQYVNYSNITLKAGGPHTQGNNSEIIRREINREAVINSQILKIPLCNECKHCTDPTSKKLCLKRLEVRNKLLQDKSIPRMVSVKSNGSSATKKIIKKSTGAIGNAKGTSLSLQGSQGKSGKDAKKKPLRPSIGENNRGNPLGNKKMSVPDDLLPDFCRRIGARGTNERMKVINSFVKDHPKTSVRQVTLKFAELVTKDKPDCVEALEKKSGRAFSFFLRPKFYHMLPENERPENWEKYAREDDELWHQQMDSKATESAKKEKKLKEMMGKDSNSQASLEEYSENVSMDMSATNSSVGAAYAMSLDGDETEDDDSVKKQVSKKRKSVE